MISIYIYRSIHQSHGSSGTMKAAILPTLVTLFIQDTLLGDLQITHCGFPEQHVMRIGVEPMAKKPLNCKTLHISFLVNLDVLVGWKRIKW